MKPIGAHSLNVSQADDISTDFADYFRVRHPQTRAYAESLQAGASAIVDADLRRWVEERMEPGSQRRQQMEAFFATLAPYDSSRVQVPMFGSAPDPHDYIPVG